MCVYVCAKFGAGAQVSSYSPSTGAAVDVAVVVFLQQKQGGRDRGEKGKRSIPGGP